MAEEKETKKTTTTKKSTTKSTPKEIKSEKRFCTNCGKELKEGETCSCKEETKNTEVVSINSEALLNTGKNTINTINNVLKKPDTTITEETNKNDNTLNIILIVSLAISFALYLMSMVSRATINWSTATGGLSTIATDDISYFKVFIYGILIYAIMAVIPMFAAFIIGKITRNNKFTFKRAYKLYVISNAPLIYGYLGMAVIMLINITLLNVLGLLALSIISIFCFFNFLLGFNKETTIREDRRSWALTSIVIVWAVIEILALILVMGSVVGDSIQDINNNYHYNNSFNW